jgi:hypothetical protein
LKRIVFLGGVYQPVFGVEDEHGNIPIRKMIDPPIPMLELSAEAFAKIACDLMETRQRLQQELDDMAWQERTTNGSSGDTNG